MKPKSFYFTLLGITALTAVAIGGGYYLASNRLHDHTETLKSKMVDIDVTNNQIDTLAKLQRDYEKLAPVIPQINAALPQAKQQTELLLQLQQLAGANGMKIQSITFSGSGSGGGLPSSVSQTVKSGDALVMPTSFQISGSFGQLQNFLQGIERLNRYTSVTSLSISHDKGTSLTYGVTLNAYLKP